MRKIISRKELRLKHYDYKSDGYYFATICTHNHKPNIQQYKQKVEQLLLLLPNRFSGLAIDWYVLMPTHIHVIFIFHNMKEDLGEVIRAFKALVTKNTKKPFWQRNYFEHIIRDEEALRRIRTYIENNPVIERLKFEEFYQTQGRINPTPT